MVKDCNAISFVATLDACAAKAFYADVLGLHLVAEDPFALVFDVNGRMLRISTVEVLNPASHTVLGWAVDNVESKVLDLKEKGVEFQHFAGMGQDTNGIWTSPSGERIAWFKDPDGNNLSLTEFS